MQHVDQRRVIIHPVAPGDTLQGLGLYYGIQISVLKKSNKLWTNDSIHSRKFLYIPIEECSVLRQAGAKIDDEKNKVILPPRHPPSKGSSVYGVSSKDLRVRRARSKSLLSSSHAPGQTSWATLGNLQEPMQRRALTPEIPKIEDRGGKESGQHLDSPNYFDTMPSASTLPINNAYESEDPLHFSEDPSESGSPLTVLSHSRLSEPATPLTSVGTKNTLSSVLGKSKAAPPVPSSAMTTTTLLTGSASSPLSPKRMSMTSLSPTIKSKGSSGSSSSKGKQRQHGRRGGSSSGGGASSDMSSSSPSVAVPFSEDLPATLMVHPSMTHEALAQRFKHMESASKENRSHASGSGIGGSSSASGARQQELRTNPVHNLHQVVDIRPPHIHRPSYSATRKDSVDSSSEVAPVPPMTHDTRVQPQLSSGLTEVDTGEAQPPKVETLPCGEQTLGSTGDTTSGTLAPPRTLPEESVTDSNDVAPDVSEKVAAATSLPEDAFIIYGHHEYIYRNQDQSSDEASFASDHEEYSTDGGEVSSLSENDDEVGDHEIGHGRRRRQREQEVVTIPAGRLSFFPSAEHSKRLETPEPILRLQNNSTTGEDGDGYFPPYGSISGRSKSSSSSSGPSSRSSTHSTASSLSGYLPNLPAFFSSLSKATGSAGNAGSSSGSSGSQPSRQYKGGSTRQRTALDANTFKAPTKTEAQAPVGSTARARPATMYVPHTQNQHHHVRGIPVKPTTKRTSSSQWSSFMSDTFVDDILGAVRSRLQIARRLYLGNTSVVGAIMGGDAYSRLYLGMSAKRRSIGGLETESIELDLSATSHRYSRDDTLSDAAPTVMAQLPQRRQEPSRTLSSNYNNEPPQQKQHGQREVVEEEKCHQRETSGASSIFENDDEDGSTSRVSKRRSGSNHLRYHSQGSLKRRSLRTSNPVNYPALAALVNDMDAEQKKNKKQQQQQQQSNGVEKECVSSSGATMTTTTTAATLIGEKEAIESGKEQPSSPIFDPLASTLAVSTR
ncbi:hypothetical protein BGW42_001770 [Actinomortierella wolfii]|nr:hypothetical protein BGW42_001770 [Actinomortierella wolfii]